MLLDNHLSLPIDSVLLKSFSEESHYDLDSEVILGARSPAIIPSAACLDYLPIKTS